MPNMLGPKYTKKSKKSKSQNNKNKSKKQLKTSQITWLMTIRKDILMTFLRILYVQLEKEEEDQQKSYEIRQKVMMIVLIEFFGATKICNYFILCVQNFISLNKY